MKSKTDIEKTTPRPVRCSDLLAVRKQRLANRRALNRKLEIVCVIQVLIIMVNLTSIIWRARDRSEPAGVRPSSYGASNYSWRVLTANDPSSTTGPKRKDEQHGK